MADIKSINRVAAMAGKEWLQIRRDIRSLILSLAAPVLLIILFGYALTIDVRHVKMTVFDMDRSTDSGRFIREFANTEYIDIAGYAENYRDIDNEINTGRSSVALVIPYGFGKNVKRGNRAVVQLVVDGSDSTSASVSIGYVKAIIANYNIESRIKDLKKSGFSSFNLPLDIRSRVWYNPELLSKNFIIPGLIVIMLSIISALIASLTISREWERGTMETLMTTPLRPWELVAGKIIPYLFIGLFDVLITALTGYFLFNVPIKGSFFEFYLLSLLFLTGTTGLGILVSTVTKIQVFSVQVAMVITYLPSFILSGFIFPIQNMPLPLQVMTHIIPARYLIVIVKGIALKGIGITLLRTQIIFLMIFTTLVLFACVKKLKLKLADN